MGASQIENSVPRERLKLLVADDDKVTRDLLREVFEKENFEVQAVASGEEALTILKAKSFPIVVSDIRMLEVNGLELLSRIKQNNARTVVILMTGFGNMEGAIEAIQKGAFDYVSKPFKLNELKGVVARAARHWESLNQPSVAASTPVTFKSKTIIGKSPQIVEMFKVLARATMSSSNVLIVGQSGTGKELVARGIHDNSTRKAKKFVAVNCGALAENLLESELFGHVKGAFTGAVANKAGLFEEAEGGTIFLDEIGDISPAMQVKLLRILQEGEFKPVGSNETRHCDVRVVAATHCNLETHVKEGKFREDLYYRLKVILIELPPLKDRKIDLPDLVNHFVALFSDRTGKKVSHVSDDAMGLLLKYPWPGNVRELENAIERAVAMTRTTVLYPEDFPSEIAQVEKLSTDENSSQRGPLEEESLDAIERAHILKVLEEANHNKSRAAAILGIDRKTLQRKAKRYKISFKREG